jgi:hypothetical protein
MALPAGTRALTSVGKPEVFWACSDGQGRCAVEAWPLAMALSKFGTFTGLRGEFSNRVYPPYVDTPGPDFYGSTFFSPWLSFVAVVANGDVYSTGTSLEAPTPAEIALRTEWDQPPFAGSAGEAPFLDVAGRWVLGPHLQYYVYDGPDPHGMDGMAFGPAVVTVTTAKASLAAAGYLVEDFCALTGNQPASACSLFPKIDGPSSPSQKKGRQ